MQCAPFHLHLYSAAWDSAKWHRLSGLPSLCNRGFELEIQYTLSMVDVARSTSAADKKQFMPSKHVMQWNRGRQQHIDTCSGSLCSAELRQACIGFYVMISTASLSKTPLHVLTFERGPNSHTLISTCIRTHIRTQAGTQRTKKRLQLTFLNAGP